MEQQVERALLAVTGSLRHLQELIDLAYQITRSLSPADDEDRLRRAGERLTTLLHVSHQQIGLVLSEAAALHDISEQAMEPFPPREPVH